jgi:hypothetical protein
LLWIAFLVHQASSSLTARLCGSCAFLFVSGTVADPVR